MKTRFYIDDYKWLGIYWFLLDDIIYASSCSTNLHIAKMKQFLYPIMSIYEEEFLLDFYGCLDSELL